MINIENRIEVHSVLPGLARVAFSTWNEVYLSRTCRLNGASASKPVSA